MPLETVRRRRPKTAAEYAERLGVSRRTIVRYVSEPRADYLARAAARRAAAVELRRQGLTWQQVGEQLGVSKGAARLLALRARS